MYMFGTAARRFALLATVASCAIVLGTYAAAQDASNSDDAADGELPEIVVEGAARDERALLDTPAAVSVIGPEELERRQGSNFAEVMGGETGTAVLGGPRGISQEPNIRGFEDDQVVVLLDGARQNFGGAHRGRFFVDPGMVNRVEILRGGSSTLYGSGAMGGVIRLDTKDASDFLDPGESWGGAVSAGYNSQGDEFFIGAAAAAQYGMFDVVGYGAYRPMGDDLRDGDDQRLSDSEIDSLNGYAKVGFEPSDEHRFELKYQRYADDGQTPPNANAASSATTVVDRDMLAQNAAIAWDWTPYDNTFVDLSTLVYLNTVDLTEDRPSDGRYDETFLTTIGGEIVNRSQIDVGLPVKLSYGVEGYQDQEEATRNGAARPQSPDATRRVFAGFAQAEIGLTPTLTLTPGLRYDYYELEPDSASFSDRSEDQLSPKISVNWRPLPELQLYASASRSFRAPSLTELYASGTHFNMGAMWPLFGVAGIPNGTLFTGVNEFVPNPDLLAERSSALEIGGRYVENGFIMPGDQVSISATAYAARVDNYVDQTVLTYDPSTVSGGTVYGTTRVSNTDAELWGFEADVGYDAGLWFAKAGVTIPRGHAVSGGALGTIPADRVVMTAGVRPFDGFEIGGRATFADGQDDVPSGTTETPGYTVLDLFASYRPTEDIRISAGVDNVLDRAYRVYPNGLNNPGIAFKLGASLEF